MVVAAGGSFAVSVIIARSLGARDMGIYSFAVWVAAMVASLSSLGLPDAVSKYVAEHKGRGNHALAAVIARKIVGAQVMAAGVAALIAAGVWGGLERHRLGLVVLALGTVLPSALQQTLLALMEGQQRFDLQVAATIGGSMIQIAVVAMAALRWHSVGGFLAANLISAIVLLGITCFFTRPMLTFDPAAPRPAYPAGLAKKIFGFSISVYGLWLLNLVVFDKSEMLFLRIFKTPDQLAFYSIAFALTARLATAGDSVSYVLFPLFVTRLAKTGEEGLKSSYRRSVAYLQMLMVPLCLWALPLVPRIIVLAYGSQYERVVPVIQVLLVTMLFSVTMNVSTSVVYALDRQTMMVRLMIAAAALNILLDLALIPPFAAVGAAIANGLSQAAATLGLIVGLRKLLPGSFPARISLKVYFAALASSAPILSAGFYLHAGALVLTLAVVGAGLIYVVLLMATHALTQSEIDAFKGGVMTSGWRAARG